MADIAEITKRAHDTGFEQGSISAANAILAYLDKFGPHSAAMLKAAWEAGRVAEEAGLSLAGDAPPSPVPAAEFEPGLPKMDRDQARTAGFTGNQCPDCGSFQMVRNGTCEKCNTCGATTGCS